MLKGKNSFELDQKITRKHRKLKYKFERINIGCGNFSVIKKGMQNMKFMITKFAGMSICLTLIIKQNLEAMEFSFHLYQIYFTPFK